MSGDGNTKHTEDYLTLHPWSGDNGSHEDWEKVLSLKALSLGGNIMYQWVRGEGPEITPENLDPIGRAIHAYIEAIDFKSAEKAWDSDYFWSIDYQWNWRQTRVNQIYVLACAISDGAILQVVEDGSLA